MKDLRYACVVFGIIGFATGFPTRASAANIPSETEVLHDEIWKRFVLKPQGFILDYAGLDGTVELPTAEECRDGKPNALGWWTPIENGPFFTGLYMDAILRRWKLTGDPADREKARTLMEGLMLCASVGSTPGFVARGVLADNTSHYGIGSDDQTGPWFYGLWRYLQSGAATAEERTRIIAKMVEVAKVLEQEKWRMPCDPVGELEPGQFRGGCVGKEYRGASRIIFIPRILFELTQDSRWKESLETIMAYRWPDGTTRLQLVEEGIPRTWEDFPALSKNQLWIFVASQLMVRELYELEQDPELKNIYRESLRVNAGAVEPVVTADLAPDWGSAPFLTNWRMMNEFWKPQKTVDEAVDVAKGQIKMWNNRGRHIEVRAIREPFCAAWIAALSPEDGKESASKAQELIGKVPWKDVCSSAGIFAEPISYLLPEFR